MIIMSINAIVPMVTLTCIDVYPFAPQIKPKPHHHKWF